MLSRTRSECKDYDEVHYNEQDNLFFFLIREEEEDKIHALGKAAEEVTYIRTYIQNVKN